jgi:6,7-dimethyl-8-ribityllumazine synthase
MAEPRRTQSSTGEDLAGVRVLIVEARFYSDIADELLAGAIAAVKAVGATQDVLTVQGALEIPATVVLALDAAAARGAPYDAAVALGCVVRGDTYHFEIVCTQSARGLMDLSVARGLPLGNGILTVNTEEQAWSRARRTEGDKGGDAVRAALAVLRIKRRLAQNR